MFGYRMPVVNYLPELGHMGNVRYWSYKYGERVWSPQIIGGILYRAYPREYRPGSGRGTIVSPDGSFTEGLHQRAWPYDLCLKID